MGFKPFSNKYDYTREVLLEDFPDYMVEPIVKWIMDVLRSSNLLNYDGLVDEKFRYQLNLLFRENFPVSFNDFVLFALDEQERLCNLLALMLQNYVNGNQASDLENILTTGGSAYTVLKINPEAEWYVTGIYDLVKRVPILVDEAIHGALVANDILNEAWRYCYGMNPDYEKVVSRSCDFLEIFLRDRYFPSDRRPQLKRFIHDFQADPSKLKYKGVSLVTPSNVLTDLLVEASNIRGQHTGGQGRKPTAEEAEFVLYTTIYIWTLHG